MILREALGKKFIKSLDKDFRYFALQIRKDLRDEKDTVIAVTGYPGVGKSMLASTLACLIDFNYKFDNVCFIPTAKEIEKKYLSLPMYSVLHIDEAARGLHKHRWYEKLQQKLNLLYDTEREGHYICTILIMPRFQNFNENFRNFRIKYWINIIERGIAIIYKRDEDKDAQDPWHIKENYQKKNKYWQNKRLFERSIGEIINSEKSTANYWFWFKIPPIPEEIWAYYKELKKKSRELVDESEELSYIEKLQKSKEEKKQKIQSLIAKGYTNDQIAVMLKISLSTIKRYMKEIKAEKELEEMARKRAKNLTPVARGH